MILPKDTVFPDKHQAKRARYSTKYLPQLEVGDVLLVPRKEYDNYQTERNCIYQHGYYHKKRFEIRNTNQGIMVRRAS